MRILVLGGYGLIGRAVVRELLAVGHTVSALGRSAAAMPEPRARPLVADLSMLTRADDWAPYLQHIDAVVNAAGALQDGARDDLESVHHLAVASLVEACETKSTRLVHVSAPGARVDATTEFMRSKARGDAAVRRSKLDWVIVRPGLVLGADAYGGSALLRALAAAPGAVPLALADARVQTVALDDVAVVVREAVEGRIPTRSDVDVVEDEPHTLREIVLRMRRWMGIRGGRVLAVPAWAARLAAAVADALGHLGWRSPLRSTAMRALEDGVLGNAAPLGAVRGRSLRSLDETLEAMTATAQERWFARAWPMMPLMVATLCAFWVASGIVALADVERAAALVPAIRADMARMLVVAGAVLDLALGIAILVRQLARAAAIGMAAASIVYLVAGSIMAPALWLDPLGAYVKVIPGLMLAVATAALLPQR